MNTVIILPILLALLAFLVWASAFIGSGIYIRCLCSGSSDRKAVCITFDDGPDPKMTPRVLDVLRRHHAEAAFFVIGEKAAANPDLIRRIVREGHLIGNHTRSHSDRLPLWSAEKIADEISDTKNTIENIIGKRPVLFRPPFGVTNPNIARAAKMENTICIGWSIRSLDTVDSRDRKKIAEKVGRRLHNGAVILLHDRCADADLLLENILSEIERKGYGIIGIEKMFSIRAYE